MKTIFINAIKKIALNTEKLKELEKHLPNTIYLAYSIQYKKLAEQVKNKLKSKKILGFSQILGCSDVKTNAKAILLIGEARFHALNLAVSSGREVYVYDNHSISRISKEEIESIKKKEKGKYLKFLSSSSLGIIVSIKQGQNNIKTAEILSNSLEKQGKNSYLFISDTINIQELENFPDIQMWINTACPRLSSDSEKIINYSQLNHETADF